MRKTMEARARIHAIFALAALALAADAADVRAQDELGDILATVDRVELVSPRMDGPQTLVLFTQKGRVRPAAGVYVSGDRKTLTIRDGRIVQISDPPSKLERFRVASLDQVFARYDAPGRLYLKDAEGRTVALPDGRFTSREGLTLLIREGAIVAYGRSR